MVALLVVTPQIVDRAAPDAPADQVRLQVGPDNAALPDPAFAPKRVESSQGRARQ